MLKIGVVGNGFVGSSTIKRLEGKAELFISDPPKGQNDNLSDCDVIFICINETNHSMENLDKLIEDLIKQNQKCFFVIRTTVIPGTTDYLIQKHNREFVFMPEFLREWNAEHDTYHPDKVVIGTEQDGIFRLLSVYFEHPNILQVKPTEAELAKLALNSLATIKVVFAEELADLSNVLNCEYKNVHKIFSLDQNVNIRHLTPSKDGYRGAGEKCLPKDSEFMVETGKIYNSKMNLLETAVAINKFMLRLK